LPILDRIGVLGFLRDAGARPLYGMVIHTQAGRTLQGTYPHGGEFTGLPVHGLAIRRALLDPLLLELAIKTGLDPFTGEGLYAGFRSAEMAAGFAVPASARQTARSPDLAEYAAAWSREFRLKRCLCLCLQHANRRPPLAERVVCLIRRR
jgi:hypothetical protein